MPHRKRFRVNEVHSVLDMLECDPDFLTANLYILPPDDPECSDEDSGDEDKGAPDNLSRRQLEAEAEVTVWKGNKRERLFSPDDNDDVHIKFRFSTAPNRSSDFNSWVQFSLRFQMQVTSLIRYSAGFIYHSEEKKTGETGTEVDEG